MLKIECAEKLDKEITAIEASLISLREMRDTLKAESEIHLDGAESTAPALAAAEAAPAAAAPAEGVVSQGVDAAGNQVVPGHPAFVV